MVPGARRRSRLPGSPVPVLDEAPEPGRTALAPLLRFYLAGARLPARRSLRQDRAVLPAPRSWSEVTATWMTKAMAARCPGVVIDNVEIEDLADGTNRRATLRLSYAKGTGPTSVFVKAQGRMLHRLALVALGAFATEARLADSGLDLPLHHPLPYASAINWSRLAALVVMEDITKSGGRPNQATTPLDVAEVREGLGGLARLHAAYWDRELPSALSFLRPWRLGRVWAPVSGASLLRGIARLARLGQGMLIPARLDLRHLEAQFRRSAVLAASGPQTVLHGDPHPGNTYSLPGKRTGFYDWQLARQGNWSHDVGYFLVSSLDTPTRRIHERALLAAYLDALRSAGVVAPAAGEAWARYRATPAFGLGTWLHTLSAGSFQPDDVCLVTLARFAAAYEDLETHRSLVAAH